MGRRWTQVGLGAGAVLAVLAVTGCIPNAPSHAAAEGIVAERSVKEARSYWMYRFQLPKQKASISQRAEPTHRATCG